jgi:hypothetical protein
MTIYQDLREAGFKESPQGPVVVSGLAGIVERLVSGRIAFAILPGDLVPEARVNSYPNYPENAFKDNYVPFLYSGPSIPPESHQ